MHLSGVRPSVRLSVLGPQQQSKHGCGVGSPLWARHTQDIDRLLHGAQQQVQAVPRSQPQ